MMQLKLFTKLLRNTNQYKHVNKKCAEVLIPFIDVALKNHKSKELKNDYLLTQYFVIIVVYILHNSSREKIAAKYSSLSAEKRNEFIRFLEYLVCIVLRNDPTDDRREKKNNQDCNYSLFHELSSTIVELLNTILVLKVVEYNEMVDAMQLMIQLMNKYQNASSMKDILLVICHYVDYNKNYFFSSKTDCYNALMDSAIELIRRKIGISRAAGAALIIHCFFVEYQATSNIICTSHYFFDKLAVGFLDSHVNESLIFKSLLDVVKIYSRGSSNKNYVSVMNERIEAGNVIFEAIEKLETANKSPEFITERLLEIADQFFTYPELRIKWLKRIIDVNTKHSLWSSVYVAEIRVAALCTQVIKRSKKEYIPELDFSFVHSACEEERIDISKAGENANLLTNDDDFNYTGIVSAVERSVEAAEKGSLLVLMKQSLNLLMSLYESKRDFKQLSVTAKRISEMQPRFINYVTDSVFFYYIERRERRRIKEKLIFVSNIEDSSEFIKFMNSKECSRFETGEAVFCENIGVFLKKPDGIFVTRTVPLKENKDSTYHKEFFVDYNDERYIFSTKAAIPYISSSVPVIKTTKQTMTEDMILSEDIRYITAEINELTKEMKPLIPNESYNKEWSKKHALMPTELYSAKLLNAVDAKLVDRILPFIENFDVHHTVLELYDELNKAIPVYTTLCKRAGDEKSVKKITFLFENFSTKLLKLEVRITPIQQRSNPLSYKRRYEEF